jgi:hypothetical protein
MGAPDRLAHSPTLLPLLWLILVLFALFLGGFFLWQQQSQRGGMEPEYSTYRTDALGAKALFLTLENMGYHPVRWQQDFSSLPSPGLLFLIAPPASGRFLQQGDVLPYEIKALDDWVRRGNTVVVLSSQKNSLYEALGVFPSVPKTGTNSAAAQPGPLTDGVPELALAAGRVFRFGHEPEEGLGRLREAEGAKPPPPIPEVATDEWLPLFGTAADPVVVVAARGRGQYILVADPHPASNLGLAKAPNRRFMANLAALGAGGAILFDEAHHRDLDRGFVAYARTRHLTPFLLYLLALVALALWRSGVRFGVPVPFLTDSHRDSAEYVRAVAALYQTAGMGRDALAANYDQFRRRASAWLGIGSHWRAEAVAQRFTARTGQPAAEVWQTLNEIEAALTKSQVPPATAFALVVRLAALEKEIPR